MLSDSIKAPRGFTLLELLVTLAIIAIIAGAIVTMSGSFGHRQRLETSALKLIGDLRQAQQFSRVRRTKPGETYGYGYHGLRFYGSLGEDGDREGWKILRFCTDEDIDGDCDSDPSLPITFTGASPTFYEVVKSSVEADNPEFLEDTFFAENVTIDTNSGFQINPVAPQLHSIIFTPEGSATSGGEDLLLTGTNDDIILSGYGNTKTIHIAPLTGHVKIE